ncbi:fimbria/pilus outer membrane usher protein [Roseovarius sp. C7]|uniref:fimbria/pilus outer membrane usher protein n=1 Tax=Roseovarius sp. C7 TaxID=3398643 RepID=UPI0039F6D3DA
MTSDRTRMLGLFLTATMIVGLPTGGKSEETDSLVDIFDGATGGEVPLFLAVSINGKDTGLVAEFTAGLDGENMRSTRSELTQIGLEVPPRLAQTVALHEIDGVRYTYDPIDQAVDIQAPYSALRPDIRSASYAQDFEEPDRSYGAVVNYSVVADRGFGGDFSGSNGGLSANLDGWIFAPYGQLRSTAYFSRPFASEAEDQNIRLETTMTTHLPDKAITVSVGDFTTAGPSWTRPIRMGGVQVRRDFSLRSDLVTDQRLSYSGAAAVPSSVDVFIENNRVYSTNVDSGPYQLEDVPIQGGGDAEIVVRGIDGQVSRRTVSFFDASNLLKKGVADYSFGVGFAREAFGFSSNEYGENPVFRACCV